MIQGMNTTESERNASLDRLVMRLIEERKPQSVRQLVNLVRQETSLPEQEIISHIMLLQNQRKIRLSGSSATIPKEFVTYVRTREALWYWVTLGFAALTAMVALTLSEDAYPAVYIRYVLGTFFVTWIPGYSMMKALYPRAAPFKVSSGNLELVERVLLSIGLSWALVPLLGLLLNFTPWGISLPNIVVGLLTTTIVSATIGIIREHKSLSKNMRRPG